MTKRSYSALKAKRNGERFEHLIDVTCVHYKLRGIAYIQKTPEPMKQIATINKQLGHFKAHYLKKAQPDFQGTLKGGQSIVFEAKHTNSTNLPFDRISKEQERDLAYHDNLEAWSGILISFGMKKFYMVPYDRWKWFKENLGKKSVNQNDLVDYEISTDKGLLNLLEGMKLTPTIERVR